MYIQWQKLITLHLEGLQALVEQHHNEAGKEACELNVNWPRYKLLEDENIIRWIGMYKSGALIGYASVCITHPLHHQNELNATIDTIYLSQPHRKGFAGQRAIKQLIGLLKEEGVKDIIFYERERLVRPRVSIGTILSRMGFAPYERGWRLRWVA